jgi:hypothetical protein
MKVSSYASRLCCRCFLKLFLSDDRATFKKRDAPRVLDMPIKFPGSNVRLPVELKQFQGVIQQMIDFEMKINSDCYDEYYAYTIIF